VTKIDLYRIKKELQEQRNKLLSFINVSEEDAKENLNNDDLAHQYQIYEQKNSLNSYNQKLLDQIENALKKIENGTYGICDRCGKPIDADRLNILPYANLCMDCLNKIPSSFIYSSDTEL